MRFTISGHMSGLCNSERNYLIIHYVCTEIMIERNLKQHGNVSQCAPLLINHGSNLELLHRRELDFLNFTEVFAEDWTFGHLRASFIFFWHSLILSLRIIKWCNGMEDQRVPNIFPLRSQEQSISSMLHFLEHLYYEKHLGVFRRVHKVKKSSKLLISLDQVSFETAFRKFT